MKALVVFVLAVFFSTTLTAQDSLLIPDAPELMGIKNQIKGVSATRKRSNSILGGINNRIVYSSNSSVLNGMGASIDSSYGAVAIGSEVLNSKNIFSFNGKVRKTKNTFVFDGSATKSFGSFVFGGHSKNSGYVFNWWGTTENTDNAFLFNGASKIARNEIISPQTISNNALWFGGEIVNNRLSSSKTIYSRTPGIQYCRTWDGCAIDSNNLSGIGATLWDIVLEENSFFRKNTISGDSSMIDFIHLMNGDNFYGNNIVGNNAIVESFHHFGNSNFSFNKIYDSVHLNNLYLFGSSNVVENEFAVDMEEVLLLNSSLTGVKNEAIDGLFLVHKDLDLSGYGSEVANVSVFGGQVGIGTFSIPTATLEINGTLKYIDSNQADGKILISDNEGNATWQNADSLDFSSVPSYPNNMVARAALGTGKLYYTDTSGEYILKITH